MYNNKNISNKIGSGVLFLALSLLLTSCGGDSETSSGNVESTSKVTEPNTDEIASTDDEESRNERLEHTDWFCTINNVSLSPGNGATIRRGETIKVTVDYTMDFDPPLKTDYWMGGAFVSEDGSDTAASKGMRFWMDDKPGRYINGFTFVLEKEGPYGNSNATDHYTKLSLKSWYYDSSCSATFDVDYIFINE